MAKWYAVKVGRKTGKFTTWDECKVQVNGFAGAKYKSFNTEWEADQYLQDKPEIQCEAVAYTDGSFNDDKKISGGGGFIEWNGQRYAVAAYRADVDTEFDAMRNVGGEILGAVAIIQKAQELGIKSLRIYHDYEGVGAWVKGEWKTNTDSTSAYATFAQMCPVQLEFSHVTAHTGIEGNEAADRIAKFAVGLNDDIRSEFPNIQWVKVDGWMNSRTEIKKQMSDWNSLPEGMQEDEIDPDTLPF